MKKTILIIAICAISTHAQSQSWNLTGNAGTNTSTNFIGTTDNKSLKIRTNNAVRITISSAGKVGIGITSPLFKLDVKGGSINTDSVYRIGGNTVLSVKGAFNTFVGVSSGNSNTTGNFNTACGMEALYTNTSGYSNTACGLNALHNNNTGFNNAATGRDALYSNTAGTWNVANGQGALFLNTTGHFNTSGGANALYSNTTGNSNTATGTNALYNNTTGISNTASGMDALYSSTTGDYNTATGYQSLYSNTTGYSSTANGMFALYSNTTGHQNTATGREALYSNTTGKWNSAFGNNAGFDLGDLSNTTCIGHFSGGIVDVSNRVEIGNSSASVIAGQVGWSTYSDERIKENIKENVPGLSFISKLRPVTYNLNIHRENEMVYSGRKKDETDWEGKYDIEKIKMTGFLAQEVEQAAKETGYDFSGVQVPANPEDLYSLRYSDFVVPLVKAVQELSKSNDDLKSENEKLIHRIEKLEALVSKGISSLNHSPASLPSLEQNSPNPFSVQTEIKFQLPAQFNSAQLVISDEIGKQISAYHVQSSTPVIIKAGQLSPGIYTYLLIVDGITVDSKQMLLTK